ncbi:cytoskeleton protein RodZ [Photobacterium atrarenae]|uniref:Cytoskeleton protein RodZ n=1 Tax=Photobacterium atrarenae TaxID=865757 RepID=A0ABY5GEW2_9GAMM|nr:cytoskeleton protein RodZ [Photobacterium atrarenae]UTV27147.1 cytoskeleton protein RodZ [Photobacterium atrarenae]
MNTEQNEEISTEEVIRPGDMLRQAREQLGYSQKDIASRLRLRLSVINDIEDNHFEQSQLATFTRGYVRSYAKFVGLDEREVLARLDKEGHAQPENHEMQSFSRRTKREAHDNRIMRLTWALAIIFIGMTGVWWWQSLQMEPDALDYSEQQSQPLDESLAGSNGEVGLEAEMAGLEFDEPVLTETGSTSDLLATEAVTQVEEPAPVTSFEAPTEPAAGDADATGLAAREETAAQSAEPAPVVEAITSGLQLTFSGDCWIDIRDANGKRLETGIKKSGDVLNLDGAEPYKLVLGAPSVVKINYKGEPVDLSQYPAGKVARFKLPQ